jgi:hypothetical protein
MKEELPKRLLILGSTAVFFVFGVIGVSASRDIAARYGNIQIPVAWYLFPIVLAVLVVASALLLPAAVLRWRRGVVVWLLFLVTVLLGSTSPLLYIIYDFEHRLSSSSPPINAVERTASQPTGSRVKAASYVISSNHQPKMLSLSNGF